jgi:hypothetical protein
MAGTSSAALARIPNPRVRVLDRPLSPSPDTLTYWLMEPSDLTISSRGHRESPCTIHGWGSCPYMVVPRQTVLSSPSLREGEEKGGEGVTAAKDEEEEDPVEVILVLNSPTEASIQTHGEDPNWPKRDTHQNPST